MERKSPPQLVTCCSSNDLIQARLYYEVASTHHRDFVLHFVSERDALGHLVATEYNVFDALCRLRAVLEFKGYLICCNGARHDTWASGMSKEMGGGRRVYTTIEGQPAHYLNLVPTLGPADCNLCVSLSSQLERHIKWMRSIIVDGGFAPELPGEMDRESTLRTKGYVHRLDGTFVASGCIWSDAIIETWEIGDCGKVIGAS